MKLDYKDFILAAEYIKRNCENQEIVICTTPTDDLIIKTHNSNDEEVTIKCFNFTENGTSFPKITRTERLTKDSK